MPHPIEPSQQHFDEAFARMHKADWPAHTFAELSRAARLYGLVTGSAHRIANGHHLVTAEADIAGPITNSPPASAAPLRDRAHVAGVRTFPARRRDDDGVDFKSRAAGEKAE